MLNRAGRVFIGRRSDGPEHVDATHAWQMPQGGVDPGEDTWQAALRELHEETNIRSVERLGEIADWLTYDIPNEISGEPGTANIAARAEMVRDALHRRRARDRPRASRRRPQAGIHRLALGADGEPAGPGGAVQAQGLRADRPGVFEVRKIAGPKEHLAQNKNAARRPRFI